MTDSFDYRDYWGVRSPSARPAEDPEDFWASPDDAENRRLQEWQQREERQAQQRVAAMRSALKTLGPAPQDPDDPGALAQDEAREQAGARAYMHAKAETRRKFVEAEIGKMSEGPPTARGLEATRAWLNRHKPEDAPAVRATEFRPEWR